MGIICEYNYHNLHRNFHKSDGIVAATSSAWQVEWPECCRRTHGSGN